MIARLPALDAAGEWSRRLVARGMNFWTTRGSKRLAPGSLPRPATDYFDLAYSELAFQHMLKPIQESYVKEIFRVLKKEGSFYVQIPRLEYYNDKTYSRTRKETDELFQEFSVTYEDTSDAYYYIKAKK